MLTRGTRLAMALVDGAADAVVALLGRLALGLRRVFSWLRALLAAVLLRSSLQCSGRPPPARSVKDIPGPRCLPVLGTRWIFSPLVGRYALDKVHEAYRDMFRRYGNIVKEEGLWNVPVVSVRAAADIEKVMRLPSPYPMRPPDITADFRRSRPDRYSDGGLVNEQGEKWHQLRVLTTSELIKSSTVQKFLPELNLVLHDLISRITELRDVHTNRVANVPLLAKRVGLESACVLLLGQRLGFLERELKEKARRLGDAMQGHFNAVRDAFYGIPLWKIYPTSTWRNLIKAEEETYDAISELVEPAIEQSEAECPVEAVQSVLMSVLQRPELLPRDKKSAIVDFISSAVLTLGSSLTFLLYNVATHADAQQRLFGEISAMAQPEQPLTAKMLQSATYLRACMQESFRLLPTAPLLCRIIDADLELCGHFVPSGSVVLIHNWEATLDERNFVHAHQYLPERWLPEEAAARGLTPRAPFLVAPFGCQRRICPGKKFSEHLLLLVLARLVQRFEIHCDAKLELTFEFLLGPKGELPFTFIDR